MRSKPVPIGSYYLSEGGCFCLSSTPELELVLVLELVLELELELELERRTGVKGKSKE